MNSTIKQLDHFVIGCLPNHRLESNFIGQKLLLSLLREEKTVADSKNPNEPKRYKVKFQFVFDALYVIRKV
ncbi:hypothetical protein BLOT_001474 [Blomia tropicalis]|nr:hypothetical protein BLOT_001474 [Blomia tropicalis]